jgi:hypothetical protein
MVRPAVLVVVQRLQHQVLVVLVVLAVTAVLAVRHMLVVLSL